MTEGQGGCRTNSTTVGASFCNGKSVKTRKMTLYKVYLINSMINQ